MKFARKYNEYYISPEGVIFYVFHRGVKLEAKIDYKHRDLLNTYYWSARKHGNTYYVTSFTSRTNVNIHNLILGCKIIDHIDGNGLNNLDNNLRKCSFAENSRNKSADSTGKIYSKYKGVTSSYSKNKKFRASIFVDGRRVSLGLFYSETEAALAYNKAALTYFGNFARLNVIEDLNNTK